MKRFILSSIVIICFSFSAIAQDNAAFFPELDGWKKPDSLSNYTANNLWDIIDGAADGYLLYDFELMTMGDYTQPDGKYITLEIYRHQSYEDAFGIYSQERPSKATYNNVGGQGYQEDANLNFFAGRYYIKIRCSEKTEDAIKSVRKLGETIANQIDPSSKLPAQIVLFPLEGKVANSEQYINQNFMGYSFFKNAFIANYNVNGSPFNMFIILNNTADEAKTMLSSFLKNNGKEQTNLNPGILDIKDKYNGTMRLLWKGKYLCGIYNTADTKIMQDYIALLDVNLK
jgi:hypothetical protein